jgi:erythromycin esterase-like protein
MTSFPHEAGWAFEDDRGIGTAFAAFLRALPATPRLLGLGEPMHGEEAFPRLRNALWQHLVEHEGYRSVAIESDAVAGLVVDDFVGGGDGSLDEVMATGFSHTFGGSPANRELVAWMREFNRRRSAVDRVRFFGFDAPLEMSGPAGPRTSLTALHSYLSAHLDAGLVGHSADTIDRLLGDDGRWTNPAATMDPAQSVGASADVSALRVIADDLTALLTAWSPHLIAASTPDDRWRAGLHGRTAAGLLRYHAGMADTSPSRIVRLMGLRDAMMADNLTAILDGQSRHGRTLAFAHNRHLQRDKSTWQLGEHALAWWSAGAIVGAHLGDAYAFVASGLGSAPHQGLGVPPADTLEGVLSTMAGNGFVIGSQELLDALDGAKPPVRPDTSNGYFALDPEHLAETDGIAFLARIEPGEA